jgi:pSer/pThr/pTyr-binding forkhead associated (FHA) protein
MGLVLALATAVGLAGSALALEAGPGPQTASLQSAEPRADGGRADLQGTGMRANSPESAMRAADSATASGGKEAMVVKEREHSRPSGPAAATAVGGALGAPGVDWTGWLMRGALSLLTLPMLFWVFTRPRGVNTIAAPGFEVISPTETRRFIPLAEKYTQLDFIGKLKTEGALRISANLNKVSLSSRRFGYLMEDKNYRNALLVNRRRVRRTMLKDGDVLDLGDLTLLYRDNRHAGPQRNTEAATLDAKAAIKFDRALGPIRRGTAMLTSDAHPNRAFYITKNLIFIGRSEDNDLIIKSAHVQYRHARIERVGGRYKLQDLSQAGNTFVNNRRVEQRYLREGDEISVDAYRFKFGFVTRPLRDRPAQSGQVPAAEAAPETDEGLAAEDAVGAALEPEGDPT